MGSFERHSCYFLNPEMGPLGSCLTALLGLLGGVRQESGLKCTPASRPVSLSLLLSRSSPLRWASTLCLPHHRTVPWGLPPGLSSPSFEIH